MFPQTINIGTGSGSK